MLDQGMLRVDGRLTVGGTDRPGTISALDLGVALSPVDDLELGFSTELTGTLPSPAGTGLLSVLFSPEATYGDIPIYARYRFHEGGIFSVGVDLVAVIPANTDFVVEIGIPLRVIELFGLFTSDLRAAVRYRRGDGRQQRRGASAVLDGRLHTASQVAGRHLRAGWICALGDLQPPERTQHLQYRRRLVRDRRCVGVHGVTLGKGEVIVVWYRRLALGIGLLLCTPEMSRAQDALLWDGVLAKYAKPYGFDYRGLLADREARRAHRGFVAQLATMPEEAPLADWLNAYNALVVDAVLQRFPLPSVREVPRFFRSIKYEVAGKKRSLDDLEHGIIRPRFEDPRIHVALNCGARSCPPLHPRAFVSSTLDATLDALSRAVVGDPSFVQVEEDSLSVSRIFHWYSEDFEKDAGSVLEWLQRYDAAGRLDGFTKATRLKRLPYDWKLNVEPPQ